jgi:hypothetical protein
MTRRPDDRRYWFRWHSADGAKGPRIGPFYNRKAADVALLEQVRAAAEAMEHGTGKAGVWTPDGAIYRDDLDDRLLGRYVVERGAPETGTDD